MRIASILRPVGARLLALVLVSHSVQAIAQTEVATKLPEASSSLALGNGLSAEIQFEKLPRATSAPVVTALASSKDGKYLAVAGDDHAIRIVDTSTGKTIQTVIGHLDWIQSLLFVYSNDQDPETSGEALVPDLYSAGHDGRVLRWKYSFPLEAEEVAIVPYAVRSISVSAERQLLAIGGFSDEVLLYDLQEGQYVQRLKCEKKDQRTVRFSPDGTRVLSGSRDGQIRVWETDSGKLVANYRGHQRRVHTAVFSTDGNSVTSAGEDRRVVRYDLQSNSESWSTEIALSKMMALCLVNDDMVAVAGADNKIRLLDAQSESIVAELIGHTGTVAVMSHCGDSLASGSFDTTVRVWNLTQLDQSRVQKSVPTSRTPIKVDANTQIR